MEKKIITVKYKTWKILTNMKIESDMRSINDVIEKLVGDTTDDSVSDSVS